MLHGVILAGGAGTRFWPLSRRDLPKQLLPLASSRTLLQQSFDRLRGATEAERIWIVTTEVLAARVRQQLPELPTGNVIVEPALRDTAVAIALAARLIQEQDPDAILAVVPADHVIRPVDKFRAAIAQGAELAQLAGRIVTLGIPPTSPNTGYGYLRRGPAVPSASEGGLPVFLAQAFEEKPDQATAEAYLSGGEHYWNSGIFLWSAKTILSSLEQHLPKTRNAVERIARAWSGNQRHEVLKREYEGVERISIDYAVLEKAQDILVLEANFEWSDLGSWSAVSELHGRDERGLTVENALVCAVESTNCLVQGDGRLIALLGVEDLVVVQTRDATLICHVDRAEDVKRLVETLGEDEDLRPYT